MKKETEHKIEEKPIELSDKNLDSVCGGGDDGKIYPVPMTPENWAELLDKKNLSK